jgi:hypothetical protein
MHTNESRRRKPGGGSGTRGKGEERRGEVKEYEVAGY